MSARFELAGNDVTVAAIVSGAADDAERSGLTAVLRIEPFGSRLSCARHQGSRAATAHRAVRSIARSSSTR